MSPTWALCPVRVGIVSLDGLADENAELVHFLVDLVTGKQDNPYMTPKKNPHAQALGSLGGKARAKKLPDAEITKIASKGGKARAAKLSAPERSRIAKLGVAARENKRKGNK
jgi:hypothetical protein